MQTAVEWLVEQLPLIQQEGLRDVIEETIHMEKQQIMDAYIDRMDCTNKEVMRSILGEQYYNETYGSKKRYDDMSDKEIEEWGME
jgi:hypothetical protein